jgi:hypothetical protein
VVEGDPTEVIPRQPGGRITGTVDVPRSGRYEVWLGGSFGERFVVSVDGRRAGSVSSQLGPLDQALNLGTIYLSAGRQPVQIMRPPSGFAPNDDDANPVNRLVGPLMLVPDGPSAQVHQIAPRKASSLCGRSLNWLEVVR